MAERARYGGLFAGWAAAGFLLVAGAITSLWIFAWLPAIALMFFLSTRDGAGPAAWGLLAGAGSLLLYIAYDQRDGPGTHCVTHPDGGYSCGESMDPRPWLVTGLVLVAASLTGMVIARRQ